MPYLYTERTLYRHITKKILKKLVATVLTFFDTSPPFLPCCRAIELKFATDPGVFFNRPRWLFQPTPVAISTDPDNDATPFFGYQVLCERGAGVRIILFSALAGCLSPWLVCREEVTATTGN